MEIIAQFFHDKSGWELVAVACALAYLALAIKESLWCWPAAFVSTAIYTVLFWHVSLLMESALNVYYMAMAIYGWWSWTKRRSSSDTGITKGVQVCLWPWHFHALGLLSVIVLSYISGTFLHHNTHAAWPYLDSFTTWASVLTTYMVAKKVLENWLYWMVINSLSIFLYLERELYPTALLLGLYLGMSVYGYFAWQKSMRKNTLHAQSGSRELA